MKSILGTIALLLVVTPAFAANTGSTPAPAPRAVPGTGPGSPSFNAYVQSHSGLAQHNAAPRPVPVPGTGPGSASFNSYVQSHSGLAQYNNSSPSPTMPTMPRMSGR
jgi:hypothetical protein